MQIHNQVEHGKEYQNQNGSRHVQDVGALLYKCQMTFFLKIETTTIKSTGMSNPNDFNIFLSFGQGGSTYPASPGERFFST